MLLEGVVRVEDRLRALVEGHQVGDVQALLAAQRARSLARVRLRVRVRVRVRGRVRLRLRLRLRVRP